MKTCPECGAIRGESEAVCPNCGAGKRAEGLDLVGLSSIRTATILEYIGLVLWLGIPMIGAIVMIVMGARNAGLNFLPMIFMIVVWSIPIASLLLIAARFTALGAPGKAGAKWLPIVGAVCHIPYLILSGSTAIGFSKAMGGQFDASLLTFANVSLTFRYIGIFAAYVGIIFFAVYLGQVGNYVKRPDFRSKAVASSVISVLAALSFFTIIKLDAMGPVRAADPLGRVGIPAVADSACRIRSPARASAAGVEIVVHAEDKRAGMSGPLDPLVPQEPRNSPCLRASGLI